MNELQIFNNEEFGQVRVIEKDGQPWFVAKDVCDILEIQNTTDAVKRLDDDEVTRLNLGGLYGLTNLVNESGLYSLILGSRKKEAKAFKKWLTSEVIPSIRKHGMYATPQTVEDMLNNPDTMIQTLQALKQEREEKEKLQLENGQQKQIIGELKPKADYVDRILKNKGLVTMTQIAKDYGKTAQQMNELLHELKIQYKQSKQWLLYKEYHDKGYAHSETINIVRSDGSPDVKMNTKWTQKGRLFLYNLLKENEVSPLIERGQRQAM